MRRQNEKPKEDFINFYIGSTSIRRIGKEKGSYRFVRFFVLGIEMSKCTFYVLCQCSLDFSILFKSYIVLSHNRERTTDSASANANLSIGIHIWLYSQPFECHRIKNIEKCGKRNVNMAFVLINTLYARKF